MSRFELQNVLEEILQSNNVYFQPPESISIQYPCIIYRRNKDEKTNANNKPYNIFKRYSVIVIDKNPDTVIPDKIIRLPMSSFVTTYTVNNLNHYVYDLYY